MRCLRDATVQMYYIKYVNYQSQVSPKLKYLLFTPVLAPTLNSSHGLSCLNMYQYRVNH